MDTQTIIEYIKDNPNSDGIDIAIGLKMPIAETYSILHDLENKLVIERVYIGICSYYIVKQ